MSPLRSALVDSKNTDCTGCGTCCRKGGPALHREDIPLLQEKAFSLCHLVTVRQGESAFDQVEGALRSLDADIIKFGDGRGQASVVNEAVASQVLKQAGLLGCAFLQEYHDHGELRGRCGIYAVRPAECRALLCRDTRAIAALYNKDRLGRADVLEAVGAPAMWHALMQAYDEACPASHWDSLLRGLADDKTAEACTIQEKHYALNESIRLDMAYRELAFEKAALPLDTMNFLFGRPLLQVAKAYGLQLTRNNKA